MPLSEHAAKVLTYVIGALGVAFVIVGAILLIIAFTVKHGDDPKPKPDPGPGPDPKPKPNGATGPFKQPSVTLEPNARKFYMMMSTDGLMGRNDEGDLIDGTSGAVLEPGLKTKADLLKWPLTFAMGHPFWTNGSTDIHAEMGKLVGGSWEAYLATFPAEQRLSNIITAKPTQADVLVIECSKEGGSYSPVIMDILDLDVTGIVVRHNGILLIPSSPKLQIRTQFIMVESGGLLQAGTNFDPAYRYQGKLEIILTHPPGGFDALGAVASQYTWKSAAPGASHERNDPQKMTTPFTGDPSAFGNGFGAKVIGIGFNGSIHLSGKVGKPSTYKHTWQASNKGDAYQPMTVSADSKRLFDIETEYPTTWVRMSNAKFDQGTDFITVSAADRGGDFGAWSPGSQVVLTNSTSQYTSSWDPQGMSALWVDNDDPAERALNQSENDKFIGQFKDCKSEENKKRGVEVCKIKSYDAATGKLTFMEPLRFTHDSSDTVLNRTTTAKDKQVTVTTCLHVGLLSRSIVIRSDMSGPSAGGCNRSAGQPTPPDPPIGHETQIDLKGCGDPGQSFWSAWDKRTGCLVKKWPDAFPDACSTQPMMLRDADRKPCTDDRASGCSWYCPDKERGCDKQWYKSGTRTKCGAASGAVMALGVDNPKWKGPGGFVRCNTQGKQQLVNSSEVFSNCYENEPYSNAEYCNNEEPQPPKGGHWIFGTGTKETSCSAILGGHQMYKTCSSICYDGVELKYMGQAPNFGSIARYGIHFHLAGYTRSFKDYLPEGAKVKGFERSADVVNCATWCSFSRWVTLHGVHEVNVKNNVCFICFGSGLFIEDGTETNNTIEHNICVGTLVATFDNYYNTVPIFPNVSSDMCMTSAVWLKNNQNRVLRNVMCNSPASVIAVWIVPQRIAALRGPSTVCTGDPELGLPSIASIMNTLGGGNQGLSQHLNTWRDLKPKAKTACWVPDDFPQMLRSNETRCMLWGSDNVFIPYFLQSENMVYCMGGGYSELPESLAQGSCNYEGGKGFQSCPGAGYNTENSRVKFTKSPIWMPGNGQNSCTDRDKIAQSVYAPTRWGAGDSGYPYQPISKEDIDAYNQTGLTYSRITKGDVVPKMICDLLTYNLGPCMGTLWLGPAWTKDSPAWFMNCAFLEKSWRMADPLKCQSMDQCPAHDWMMYNTNHDTRTLVPYPPWYSSLAVTTAVSDGQQKMAAVFGVFHNVIADGGFGPPSFPTVLSGQATFFADTVKLCAMEYNKVGHTGAITNMYLRDTVGTKGLFSDAVIGNRDYNLQVFGFWDFDRKEKWLVDGKGIQFSKGELVAKGTPLIKGDFDIPDNLNLRRDPYVCGADARLFRTADAKHKQVADAHPEWNGIVINSQTGTFVSPQAVSLGDFLCKTLSMIPKCPDAARRTSDIAPCCGPGGKC